MSSLLDHIQNKIPEYSVSEISSAIRRSIEGEFEYVKIKGEISSLKIHSSGHIYFNLKDEGAVLAAVCFRGAAEKLDFLPAEGTEIIASGRVTTYNMQSKYQLIVSKIQHVGAGNLMEIFENRKKKLLAEGLFDESRKKPIPKIPKKIAVITSETGAVIQDIIHRIEERFPLHIMLYSVAVQGKKAEGEIIEAIKQANNLAQADLIILARGGGSLEDLWAFNEEGLVRAIANSKIPIISAIGHETDTTLADFAADMRAPTPTAAAEIATFIKREDLISTVQNHAKRIGSALLGNIDNKQNLLQKLSFALKSPKQILEYKMQRMDDCVMRLNKISSLIISNKNSQLAGISNILEALSYKNTLNRGFTVIRNNDKKIITSSLKLNEKEISIEFKDGKKNAQII